MFGYSVFLVMTIPITFSFVLDGSQTSFAQFKKWNVGLNGSLEFEFKTEQPNGLLLYTDDGGTYDFFEIKLVEGALRLRYNLGGGAQILTVGRDLNDGHWHKVHVQRKVERTSLSVDGASQTRTSRGKEFLFGKLSTNSDVYVGGMPSWYNNKLTLLALPSVIFEPRFAGAIRNLVYQDEDSSSPRRQEMKMKDYKCAGCPGKEKHRSGVRGNITDACEDLDPCQHGGICISTDSGPICECRNVDYEGTFCEKDKAPSEATFRGTEFLSYDLNRTGGEPIVSSQDIISLNFKTRFSNGLLFYTGDGQDYLNIALQDGGIILTMSLGTGKLEMNIRPNRVRFDDNQWHKLTVHRKVQEISAITSFCRLSAIVDGTYSDHSHIVGTSTMLSSSRVYVGGSQTTHALPGSKIHNNFVGCLRKVEFSADTLKLNLIDLGRTGSKLLTVAGNIDFMCQELEAADPVTFTVGDSHLVLPNWEAGRTGTMSFKIRTNEANGLLMYSFGTSSSDNSDYFAFEMLDGHMFLHLNLGSGPIKVRITTKRIDDGAWHETTLRRNGKEGRVTVDNMVADFSTPGDSNLLDLDSGLFIGGIGAPGMSQIKVPYEIWTGVLRQGYVGCMRDLVINGNAVDVANFARQQDSTAIRPSCHVQPTQCDSQPCMNSGVCSEGWNRFICDCTGTSFTGPICGKDASTLTFNGTQYMTVTMPEETETQSEDLAMRFRTTRRAGLLFSTNSDHFGDKLELVITGGKLRMMIRIGDIEKTIMTGQGLDDNVWHVLKLSRRKSHFILQLDDDPPVKAEKDLDQKNVLKYKVLYVGGFPSMENEAVQSRDAPGFTGSMQQFSFNGVPYLERANMPFRNNLPKNMPAIKVTAKFQKRDHPLVHHPVTFKSKHTFVGLPALKAYSNTNIYFQFKTREPSGLMLYNGGKDHDFIAIELVNGHMHYIFNLGDGPVRIRDNAKSTLNDNKWHAVTIGRPSAKHHTLLVDDSFAIITSLGHNEKLDLSGILYIGGVRKDIYATLPKQIQSRQGFDGCLASLDLNGESPNLLVEAVVPSTQVVSGCEGQGTKCSHSVCANRGVCVQQWNSFACDCDTTSYTGPTCSDESISFEFGPSGGMITFVYPEDRRPEMKSDVITLGFITSKEDCVLLRIDSGTSNDYIELEIVEGNVFMVYNMGTNDHPIGEVNVKVNDDTYHVVRFTRSGANSTLQIDDYNIQTNHPSGHQLTVFNNQAQIQIGGKWNRAKQRIERAFTGIMSGLVFNGQRILDLAKDKDSRTSTRGDVQLMSGIANRIHEPFQRMQQTPSSNFPGVMDDLVYSGAGSGCQNDDEDQCQPVFDTGSGDDLITPVYIPPTRQPSTSKASPNKGSAVSQGGKPCDDEDCFVGSGSGELTTEDTSGGTTKGTTTVGSTTPEEGGRVSSTNLEGSTSEEPESTSPEITSSSTTTTHTTGSTRTTIGMITTTTTTSTEYPEILQPLPPRSTLRPSGDSKKRDRISSEAAENTALVIGIIAGTMIAIILIILIILRFKHRSAASYKVDESKNYQQSQGPNAALLPAASSGQFPSQNGSLRNGNGNGNGNGKTVRKQKDVKEWYV